MTESPSPNKSAQWKRVLMGGLISALLAGIGYDLFIAGVNNDFIIILTVGFLVTYYIFMFPSAIIGIGIAIVYWFLIGATVTYFVKSNLFAIVFWFVTYIISSFMTIILGILLIGF